MFFDDAELTLRKRAQLRVPPAVPETNWRPPQYFPDLSGADVIAFDTETKELDFKHGPGWARGAGHIVGVSVAARRGNQYGKWYFPLRHEIEREYNLDPAPFFRWLKHTLETPTVPKVGANLIYDVGWLTEENIFVMGDLHDVQYAEALLDNDEDVNLEHLSEKYLGESKVTSALYEWLARAYGGTAGPNQRENIYRSPPQLAGPYGEADADLPLRVFERQLPLLTEQGLMPLFRTECGLIRLLVRMRARGVTVNIPKASALYERIGRDIVVLYDEIHRQTGVRVSSVNKPHELAMVFDAVGLHYPRTAPTDAAPNGNPSFRKDFLKNLDHPIATLINKTRAAEKIRGTFIGSYILERNVKGKVHGQFHPLRGDDDGTKTGRFSSSNPNLQNLPIRPNDWEMDNADVALGKLVRELFEKDYGHKEWEKNDYSQIEYRMLAHFAVDRGDGSAERLRQTYRDDPKTDYHDKVFKDVAPLMGWDISNKELVKIKRRPVKNTNFGLLYGQGTGKLGRSLNLPDAEAQAFFRAYHEGAPYVKPTMEAVALEVQIYGYITTIAGRRTRFSLWEPDVQFRGDSRPMPLPYELALMKYGHNIKRASDYRGVNYKLQGSAADVIKIAMEQADAAGVFDVIGVPLLQVHDELDHSVIDDSPAQSEGYRELHHIMQTAVQALVPIVIDSKRGENWGAID